MSFASALVLPRVLKELLYAQTLACHELVQQNWLLTDLRDKRNQKQTQFLLLNSSRGIWMQKQNLLHHGHHFLQHSKASKMAENKKSSKTCLRCSVSDLCLKNDGNHCCSNSSCNKLSVSTYKTKNTLISRFLWYTLNPWTSIWYFASFTNPIVTVAAIWFQKLRGIRQPNSERRNENELKTSFMKCYSCRVFLK